MAAEPNQKSITLTPSWKQYFVPYLLSVLTIPVGIGLIALYFVRRKHLSLHYRVTDTQISSIDPKYQRNIDLVNIETLSVRQSRIQEKLGIGTLRLRTSASEMDVTGMENPGRLKAMIGEAVAHQKMQAKQQNFRRYPDPDFKPGSMERMDYLTGLWQQGLLSDEDYEKEKKHFE